MKHSVALAVLCWTALSANAAEPAKPDHSIKAPHYGDVLFYFFQDRPFPALTGLMVSQHFERLPRHEDEAEVLRGGLLLGYGLHREAGEIFERLIERGAEQSVRDRAWFYLAKIRYQRASLAEADQALSRIERPLPGPLEDERSLLQGQVRLAMGDPQGAAVALRTLLARPPAPEVKPTVAGAAPAQRPSLFRRIGGWFMDAVTFNLGRDKDKPVSTAPMYARFNLGVALIRGGDIDGGRALLDEIGRTPMYDEESRVLRDQANVALGFAALMQDDAPGAAKALERVRLQGAHSNKALLGFGWAAAAQKKPAQALVPWMELAGRDPSDAAVLEARIAVPYALAELGAYGQALARYQEAIGAYDQEHKALDESISAIRSGNLVKGLMESNPAEDMGWFLPVSKLPDMPHQGHLGPVLAGHEFQESFKNYRDLNFLARNLVEWQDKLGIYGDMLDHRRKAFTERLPQLRQRVSDMTAQVATAAAPSGTPAPASGSPAIDSLQSRRDGLGAEFAAAESAADGQAYATPGERALQTRLEGARRLIAQGGEVVQAEVNVEETNERLRRLSGALTWRLAQAQPERRWAAEKALRDTDGLLAEARARDAKLEAAQRDEPAKFDAFAARLKELTERIAALQPRVAALTTEQQQALQATAVVALQSQQERLVGYTNQARYAVAQLYDRATQKPGDRVEERPEGEPRAKP